MKRDMDYVRDLLLQVEGGQVVFTALSTEEADALGIVNAETLSAEDANKMRMHLELLEEAGLVPELQRYGGGVYYIHRLSWSGYEYLETIRDPDMWRKAKSYAGKAGNAGFAALFEIGKAMAKSELQKLGLPI